MNGYYGPNNGPPPVPPMQYGPPPVKKSKLPWIITALVVLAILLFSFLNKQFSPQKTAQRYFRAALLGDWETAYGYLEVPEGSLMSQAHFLDTRDADAETAVTNLKVQETGSPAAADKNFMRTFTAYYTVKGESSSRTEEIQLVRQQEKNFLFFPKWRVSSGNILAKDFVLFAPAGYEISVDQEPLTPIRKASDRTDTDDEEDADLSTDDIAAAGINGYDTYVENIFIGEHTVTASAENLETGESTFYLSSDTMDYYKVETLDISQEAVSDMQAIVQEFMRLTYQGALAGSPPSEEYLGHWIQEDKDPETLQSVRESAEELYQDLSSDLADSSYYDKIQFTRMDFSDYQSRVNETYNDEQGDLYASLYVDYRYAYAYIGISTSYQGITSKEDRDSSGEDSMSVTFRLEDGTWKIYSASMDCVY